MLIIVEIQTLPLLISEIQLDKIHNAGLDCPDDGYRLDRGYTTLSDASRVLEHSVLKPALLYSEYPPAIVEAVKQIRAAMRRYVQLKRIARISVLDYEGSIAIFMR